MAKRTPIIERFTPSVRGKCGIPDDFLGFRANVNIERQNGLYTLLGFSKVLLVLGLNPYKVRPNWEDWAISGPLCWACLFNLS